MTIITISISEWGRRQDTIYFSIRTENKLGAGEIARTIVGEQCAAGGQLTLTDKEPEELALKLQTEFLENFSISDEQKSVPLLPV
ncbi:hypothetical protein KFU94_65475 [Chloroflexi bacterium TSY]|nr:hypothetical protein [Chloroflexi bacterium TSY]